MNMRQTRINSRDSIFRPQLPPAPLLKLWELCGKWAEAP